MDRQAERKSAEIGIRYLEVMQYFNGKPMELLGNFSLDDAECKSVV